MKNGWTEAYDRAMNDLMEAKEEIIRMAQEIVELRRDRDYWHDMATRGGGNG